jgi:hypothetical protein
MRRGYRTITTDEEARGSSNMKPVSRILPLFMVVAGGLTATVLPALPVLAKQQSAKASATVAPDAIVTRTVTFKYLLPSEFVRLVKEGHSDGKKGGATHVMPFGITTLVPRDKDSTLVVSGRSQYVESIVGAARFLDVKPRVIRVSTRLVEIRLGSDGTKRETVLQSPVLTATNNTSATTKVSDGNGSETSLAVTPHINGDKTVSLSTSFYLQRPVAGKIASSRVTGNRRVSQDEWTPIQTLTLSPDEKMQNLVRSAVETAPDAAYPLYRLDVTATEVVTP